MASLAPEGVMLSSSFWGRGPRNRDLSPLEDLSVARSVVEDDRFLFCGVADRLEPGQTGDRGAVTRDPHVLVSTLLAKVVSREKRFTVSGG